MKNIIEIKEGAIFISDAHENENRKEFLKFLQKVDKGEIKTPQLFLMGDLFDFLTFEAKYTLKFFHEEIQLINKISQNIEVIYVEGNHDFNLQKIFPFAKVYPLKKQPIKVKYKNQFGLISHGDVYSDWIYTLSHKIFRNDFLIKILHIINGDKLSANYLKKASKKQICKKIPFFKNIIKQKLLLYDIGLSEIDFILEGHYHQGVIFDDMKPLYINLHSYGCDKKYLQIKGDKINS